eukprot:3050182-Rhodomonas_salina.1
MMHLKDLEEAFVGQVSLLQRFALQSTVYSLQSTRFRCFRGIRVPCRFSVAACAGPARRDACAERERGQDEDAHWMIAYAQRRWGRFKTAVRMSQ